MRTEMQFTTHDDIKLTMVADKVTRPRAAVLIVHGLAEHLGRYEYLTQRLNAQQINVYRFDHRGHGRSEGPRAHYDRWTDISDDVDRAFELMSEDSRGPGSENSRGLKAYVIGHSMGGYAAACFGTRFPGKAAGIILSGALTRYNHQLAGPLPMDLPADTYLKNELGQGVCSDPAVGEAYMADPLVEKQFTAGLMNVMGEGVEFLTAHPEQFVDPVLILHGLDDGLVSEKDSRDFFGEIASDDRSLRIYANMMHEIFNEFDKDSVIRDVIEWLNKRI